MKDSSIPTLEIVQEGLSVNITIPTTQALLENQGYTYNQAGFTYNQAGVAYGGVYLTNQDVIPLTLTLNNAPQIDLSFIDIYTLKPTPTGNIPLGPGFFLFIPQ